jgi:hypothetical protein
MHNPGRVREKRYVSSEFHGSGYTTYLYITSAAVKVQMQILDLSKFSKLILNIFFCRLLVYICDQDNPSFYG